MGLFRRRVTDAPAHLPLGRPGPDGAGWPDEAVVGRPSFEANALHELATRDAYTAEAHDLAEELVAAALPHVPTGATAEDEPYLRKVFTVAARVGAGLGRVEHTLGPVDPATVDRRVAAALWQARRKLPVMPPEWERAAAWFLLAGHHVARTERAAIPLLVDHLAHPGR